MFEFGKSTPKGNFEWLRQITGGYTYSNLNPHENGLMTIPYHGYIYIQWIGWKILTHGVFPIFP